MADRRPPRVNGLILKLRGAPTAVITVLQNFGWMVASRGVAIAFSLIYLAIITRSLGASGFGKFALITGAAQLLSNLFAFQSWQIIVQYGVHHAENHDEERLARLYRGAAVLDVIGALAGIVASAIILYFFAKALGLKETLAQATMVFNTITLLSLRSTPLGMLRLRDRFSLAAAAETATPTFRLIGAVLAWFVHPKLQGFLIAYAVAELLTAAAHWYAVQRIGELRLMRTRGQHWRAVFTDNPGILRYALTTNFSQSLMMSGRQLPLFLVGGLTGMAAAGAFRLAAQLSRALTMLSQLIARAAFREIVRAVRSIGVGALGAMVAHSVRLAFAASVVVFLLVALFGRTVLELIGGVEFGGAYVSLLWLVAAGCIDLVTATLLGVALLLVPLMGAEGVAAAVFANSLVQAVLLGVILLRLVRRDVATRAAD
jgi:O-antigen/teichoic acid export membrane protein